MVIDAALRRIWIVQVGEELPTDPGPPRLLRSAILAQLLVDRGHDITFWASSFNHQQKRQRASHSEVRRLSSGYRLILLKGRSYYRNVSVKRVLSHIDCAAEFRRIAPLEPKPDLILCGYPTMECAAAAVAYGRAHAVPVVIDCRDLWPDIIRDQVPVPLRVFAAPLFAYWNSVQHRALNGARAITGITDAFVDWGVTRAGRPRCPDDIAFRLAHSAVEPAASDEVQAESYWEKLLGLPGEHLLACYAGSLGRRTDLLTVIQGYRALPTEAKKRLQMVVCGKGDLEEKIAALAECEPNLHYVGKRSGAEVRSLLRRCDFGILPYHRTADYMMSYPNKVGEYLSFGLPIMTGLAGETGALLSEHDLLLPYVCGSVVSSTTMLAKIIDDPGMLAEARPRARAIFERSFNPELIYPAFAEYLEQLAGEADRSAIGGQL